MTRAPKVKYIVLHCSAGFGDRKSIEAFWKTKGWNSPGYHILVDLDGVAHQLLDFEKISNGVAGFNAESVNICYIGGVAKLASGKFVGKDTRTEAQKIAIDNSIVKAIEWLDANGNDRKDLTLLGHRDFSKDGNGNGVIESWERIKECPSFDVITEYADLQKAINQNKIILPKNRKS